MADCPELKSVPLDEAMARYRLYSKMEEAACQPWLRITRIALIIGLVGLLLGYIFSPIDEITMWLGMGLFNGLGVTAMTVMKKRTRRRVKARLAADLDAGRPLDCIKCGYDLRGNATARCPECGAAVATVPVEPPPRVPPPPPRERSGRLPPAGFGQWGG